SPEELVSALRAAPAVQAQAAVELAAIGLIAAESDPARSELARLLKEARGADAAQAQTWLAVLERRERAPAAGTEVAPGPAPHEGPQKVGASESQPAAAAGAGAPPSGPALPHPATPITATTLSPVASAAAAALSPAQAAVNASYGPAEPDWPVTVIPNPAWLPPRANGPTSSGPAAAPAGRAAPATQPQPQQACSAEVSRCPSLRDSRPGGWTGGAAPSALAGTRTLERYIGLGGLG